MSIATTQDLIELSRVSKRFGGVTALDEVSFTIRRGEVHALVGQNGAGKSTLMKLIAGVHVPDAGELRLDGVFVELANPRIARRHGISIVFQELNLLPDRTVTENIFVNAEWTNSLGFVRRSAMRKAASEVLARIGVSLNPDAIVGALPLGTQQLVEIARAVQQEARIIILDEPNSALTAAESQRLFELIRQLRERGTTVIYVSHRLDEVFALADRISVIRDGRYQGTHATVHTTIPEIIAAMIGRQLDEAFPPKIKQHAMDDPILQLTDVVIADRIGPLSFDVRPREILGLAGLEGSGIDELFQGLFALQPITAGTLGWQSKPVRHGAPRDAIADHWALVPASRRRQGLFVGWSIARNAAMAVLDSMQSRCGIILSSKLRASAQHFIERLAIATPNADLDVEHLSGGNQQKVLLAKWLAIRPRLLMLNDPTRGVDIGAKHEIYRLIRQLAAEGVAILLASSEADELLGLADRILVFRKSKPIAIVQPQATTKAQLIEAMSAS